VVYYTRGLTLRNDSSAALGYRLTTRPPFSVVRLDRTTRQPSQQLQRTDRRALEPRQSAAVHVAFCLTPDLLNYVHSLQFFEGLSPDGVELVRSADNEGPQLEFRLPLNIEFDAGSVQSVPLETTVTLPSLRLASDVLDFGVCFIGQTRELPVLLSNPTGSDSFWQCKQGELCLLSVGSSVTFALPWTLPPV